MSMREPGPGSRVIDGLNRQWINTTDEQIIGAANWQLNGEGDVESWVRVCEQQPIWAVEMFDWAADAYDASQR